jgi:hypothetical protein
MPKLIFYKSLFLKLAAFGLILYFLLGCATTLPPPKPADPQRSAIGISADMRALGFHYSCDQVYFIKVDEGEDLYTQGTLIQSNYTKGGQIYLLNAKPGRYAVVAIVDFKKMIIPASSAPSSGFSISFTPRSDYSYTTFLPKNVIKLTEVTVAPGTIAFAGKYVVNANMGFEDADDAQLHYFQLVAPGAKIDFISMGFSGRIYYRGSLHMEHRDKQAENEFLNNALENLKNTAWADIIHKRAEELRTGIQTATVDIKKDLEQSAETPDQPIEKSKLAHPSEAAKAIQQTDKPQVAPQLAAIPKEKSIKRVLLRKKPIEISSQAKIMNMLIEYDFFERYKNTTGDFVNDFADNKDGTITDKATGLMWQKSGSSSSLENRSAKEYIKQLNKRRFAGYSDWRMPTIEELASLLSRSRHKDVHMASLFESLQTSCWSADGCDADKALKGLGFWIVDFKQGQILQASWSEGKSGFSSWGAKNHINYVKAVRSIK